jgi:hypothetical protein
MGVRLNRDVRNGPFSQMGREGIDAALIPDQFPTGPARPDMLQESQPSLREWRVELPELLGRVAVQLFDFIQVDRASKYDRLLLVEVNRISMAPIPAGLVASKRPESCSRSFNLIPTPPSGIASRMIWSRGSWPMSMWKGLSKVVSPILSRGLPALSRISTCRRGCADVGPVLRPCYVPRWQEVPAE